MAGVRRTWDKDAYEEKARQRVEGFEEPKDLKKEKKPVKEEFIPAPKDAVGN